jgi:hypothetical protein
MALKLDALANAVANVTDLAKRSVDAHCSASEAHKARVDAEAARVVAEARAAAAELDVADAQKAIDALAAELEAAIGSAVATIVPAASLDAVPALPAPQVAPTDTPLPEAPVALLSGPVEPADAMLADPVSVVDPAAPDAPVAPAVAEVHGLAAVTNALSGLFKKADVNDALAAMKANEPK